ncbi:3-hydroxy-9,10-secoandrosta-1,3,5(10)-triene-9,17-dione monooxygenase reductase subunit [Speluncibacter jeojiensis]|uniref:Flavin reductase family protein n=1 Tax=Speluncibacter jeojiensis TaxID=2710754 RepID=A0A9X4M1N5_9ACTN|nr:flavin reductase family protein [Corynebacteriales bacterium D3-21]
MTEAAKDKAGADEVAIDPRQLRNMFGQFCTGITIITAMNGDEPVGFACQSFAALSLDPPLVLFCPMKTSRAWSVIESTGRFGVSMLSEAQQETCAVFGSRNPDKFAEVQWHRSPLGSPILDESLAWIDCTVETVHDGGDHYVVYGRIADYGHIGASKDGKQQRPLLFYRGRYTGIEPDKNVPAPWRADLDEFLFTASSPDTWL